MSQWVMQGLRTGIKTTHYPDREEAMPGVSPGLPEGGAYPEAQASTLAARCPTAALTHTDGEIRVDYRRCIHCFRCRHGAAPPLAWRDGYEWGAAAIGDTEEVRRLGRPFRRSAHILVVDAGDCGACLNEVRQLNNPYYNMHRLGFFITPTPRQADVLLVVGPGTVHLQAPLRKAYEAMPTPKRVVAVGACALSGSLFGPSFAVGAGVAEILPVDVAVPGHPPPPLAILHGLLVAVGRRPSAALFSPVHTGEEGAEAACPASAR